MLQRDKCQGVRRSRIRIHFSLARFEFHVCLKNIDVPNPNCVFSTPVSFTAGSAMSFSLSTTPHIQISFELVVGEKGDASRHVWSRSRWAVETESVVYRPAGVLETCGTATSIRRPPCWVGPCKA